jgi:hypothetical protein
VSALNLMGVHRGISRGREEPAQLPEGIFEYAIGRKDWHPRVSYPPIRVAREAKARRLPFNAPPP